MSAKRDQTPAECLQVLVSRLQDIQSALPQAYRSEEILHNKLLNAVNKVDACKLAYFKPAKTISGFINDLHASTAASPAVNHSSDLVNAMFADRKFKKKYEDRQKKCIVCPRQGCWSMNHAPSEHIKSLRRNKVCCRYLTAVQQECSEDKEANATDELEDIAAHILESGATTEAPDDALKESPRVNLCNIESSDNCEAFFALSRDSAVLYALSADVPEQHRYTEKFFFGLLIDTGCAHASSGGYAQYRAYFRHVGQSEAIDVEHRINCHFGISETTSKGIAIITFPLNYPTFKARILIVDENVPLHLSFTDMDKIGIFYKNIEDKLVQPESG